MRYWRIFLLNFQIVLTERSRSLVWFLIALLSPFILFLYWRGVFESQGGDISGWTLPTLSTYYFMLVIATSLLMAHIEEEVAFRDIQKGELTKYLIKPFSYFALKFFLETPYRVLQGFYGLIVLLVFIFFYGNIFVITTDITTLVLALVIITLAYLLSFTLKMVMGMSAFWFTDVRGFYQLIDAIIILASGLVLPLSLMPTTFAQISYVLPFAYIIYFPIISLQGELELAQLIQVITTQVLWLGVLGLLYSRLWRLGIKKYSGIGQ